MKGMKPQIPERPIIVYCPPFDENSGGAIVLHCLVDQMRSLGVDAYAASASKYTGRDIPNWLKAVKEWNHRRRRGEFKTHPSMNVPLAKAGLHHKAIVVYPETVVGNPLEARWVVRWLLNSPGAFGIDPEISPEEEVFYYQKAFVGGVDGVSQSNLLQVRWLREDIYSDRGLTRKGTCRMIRKGNPAGANAIPQVDQSILLDGKSHSEIAEIFNTTEVFYCHDPYTMYAYYAALCGCIPVVIPQIGLSRETWRAGFELKYGVAYGVEEMEWAKETRGQLIADMAEAKKAETQNIKQFLATLKTRFG